MPRRILGLAAYLVLLCAGSGKSAEFFPLGFGVTTGISFDPLSVSEDGSVVVGNSSSGPDVGLVHWTRSTGPDVLSTGASFSDISGDGLTIVLGRLRPQGGVEAIKLTDGDLEILPLPSGHRLVDSRATHISQDGSTIWGIGHEEEGFAAVLRWTDDGVTEFQFPRDTLFLPHAVSANGDVLVGFHDEYDPELFDRFAYRWTDEDGFQELPGFGRDEEVTFGLGVSSDGRWVVGRSDQARELFRLTQIQGTRWDGLSPPERLAPADEAWGTAGFDVTADGGLVVGRLYMSDERLDRRADLAAGIWTEETGQMVPLQDLLISEYDLGDRLEGYNLTGVYDVTDDGRFMVGHSINPAGLDEAWLVDLGPPLLLPGDYNNNGLVEQADLDLVLTSWGQDGEGSVPPTWTNDLPTGNIDQGELDGVLANWGNTSAAAIGAAAVPEPSAAALLLVVGIVAATAAHRRRQKTPTGVAVM